MSLPPEKYRSIFKMKDVLLAICYSSKCKIPDEWRMEINAAIKHCPFASDKITIDGDKMKYESCSIDDLIEYIKLIDKSVKKRVKKK